MFGHGGQFARSEVLTVIARLPIAPVVDEPSGECHFSPSIVADPPIQLDLAGGSAKSSAGSPRSDTGFYGVDDQ